MALEVTLSNMTDNASDTLPEIILTRPEKEAHDFRDHILSHLPEAKIIISPLFTIKFTKPQVDLTAFDGIIFTSSNGVEAIKGVKLPQNMPCFAVGPKTAKQAAELGFLVSQGSGNADDLRNLKIPKSSKLQKIHTSLIETSELLIAGSNALEDNAWLGGSVSFAERNLETARVNFQNAVKVVYSIEDGKDIKPVMEYEEYDVGETPDASNKLDLP